MNISYALYDLELKSPLNAKKAAVKREGALLRVKGELGAFGYADCHPWSDLGDLPLNEQLHELSQGHFTDLTRCSMFYAQLDAQARSKGQQLMKNCSIPSSHYLMNHIDGITPDTIHQVVLRGFTHLKIKVGRDLERETETLTSHFLIDGMKLRLDFNERLTPAVFRTFLTRIECLQEKIDFIEDPFPYDAEEWAAIQRDGWILACDRQASRGVQYPDSAKVLIIKPARCPQKDWMKWSDQTRIVTTYMGHPLEQMTAAYVAHQIDPEGNNIHGLLSHHVFLSNPFSRQLNWDGPQYTCPPGTGFGFDEQLEHLNWVDLI